MIQQLNESDRIYFNKLMSHPLLTQAEMADLANKIKQGGSAGLCANQKMVRGNMRLVAKVALKYYGQCRSMTFMDLIQEGAIGLQTACKKFEPSKGYKFSSYAYYWIKQTILQGMSKKDRLVRLPEDKYNLDAKIKSAAEKALRETGSFPSIKALAVQTDLSEKNVADLLKLSQHERSLNSFQNQDVHSGKLLDVIADKTSQSPEEYAIAQEKKQFVAEMISTLTPVRQQVVILHLGLNGNRPHTFAEISAMRGARRSSSHQNYKCAIKQLSEKFRELA